MKLAPVLLQLILLECGRVLSFGVRDGGLREPRPVDLPPSSASTSRDGPRDDAPLGPLGAMAPDATADDKRREFLSYAAVALAGTFQLASCQAASASADLEGISLGSGSWTSVATQSSTIPYYARICPPSFATYLGRFLLFYDEGAAAWWTKQSESYQLLPSNDAKRREAKSFGSYASSIQKGLYTYVAGDGEANIRSYSKVRAEYAKLLKSLTNKYSSRPGAIRDIALLFSMLPAVYQPIDEMLKLDPEAMKVRGSNKGSNEDNFPVNFQQDFTLLMPDRYDPSYDKATDSFTIEPKINLFEIQIENGSSVSTTFGALSSKPLSRERSLDLGIYALLGISGGGGCALTHTLVIPLDVVKTRMQTSPGRYAGLFDGFNAMAKDEGVSALFLGTQATIVGYLWYGISVYPSYAFFKRFLGDSLLSPAFAVAHTSQIALVAGALASVVASLGLTPIEACRIRAVAQPETYKPLGLLGTLDVISKEDDDLGWTNLYAGLPSLMLRQVIFGSVKFLAFERASDAIFSIYPNLRDATATALGVSLVAGGISGALSSVVSQPADSVLTYVAKQKGGNIGLLEGARIMVDEDGPGSLFRGLGSRSVWAGCIIAGQFLLYDVFRAFFGITGEDLNQVFEVVLDTS